MATKKEILMGAAALVRKKNAWCQGKSVKPAASDSGYAYCATGAMLVAAGAISPVLGDTLKQDPPEFTAASDHFNKVIGQNPVTFNDLPGRTANEVALALEIAARTA